MVLQSRKKSPEETPHYIISKDVALNEITISSSPVVDGVSSSKEILISGVNWISGKIPDVNKKYKGRIRYRQPLQVCIIEKIEGKNTGVSVEKVKEK